jgi:ribosomal-protein-alanine N-acetyltransferase
MEKGSSPAGPAPRGHEASDPLAVDPAPVGFGRTGSLVGNPELVICLQMVIARTQRLTLRHFHMADGEAMDRVFGDPEVMRYGDGVHTLEWVRQWVARWTDQYYPAWGFGMWAVVDDSSCAVIGYCGLSRFPGRCAARETEIGFRLARPHWGRGFATEAVRAARDHAFETLGLPRLIAMIDPGNVASIRVAEKIGMRYEKDVSFEGYTHPDRVYALERLAGA